MSVTSMLAHKGHKKKSSDANEDSVRSRLSPLKSRVNDSTKSLDIAVEERLKPEEAFKMVLNAIVPVVVREQNFVMELFGIGTFKPLDVHILALISDLNQHRPRLVDTKADKRLQ